MFLAFACFGVKISDKDAKVLSELLGEYRVRGQEEEFYNSKDFNEIQNKYRDDLRIFDIAKIYYTGEEKNRPKEQYAAETPSGLWLFAVTFSSLPSGLLSDRFKAKSKWFSWIGYF